MKATTCRQCREWIEKVAFEDLATAEKESMEVHLRDCADCREQRRLLDSALTELQAYPEAPVPRHFYVNPKPRLTPWGMFRQLAPAWRAVAAGALLSALAIGGAAASRLQVERDGGVLRVAFGEISRRPEFDPEQLRLELTRRMEAKLRENRAELVAVFREEMSKSAAELSDQHQKELRLVTGRLEDRLDLRLGEARLKTEADIQDAALQLYKSLSQQQRRQLALLNDRIDLLTVSGQIQGNQTEALMATMLQIADLRSGN